LTGRTVAPIDDHTIDSTYDFYRNSTVLVWMYMSNTLDDMQVLTVFKFRKVENSQPVVLQFFVGDGWVRDAIVDHEEETVALLLDVPPLPGPNQTANVAVFTRVGGPFPNTYVVFAGFEAFLL
jgi:hypothetical protein